jgi:hypothetical protein
MYNFWECLRLLQFSGLITVYWAIMAEKGQVL